jgi:hypothetical protein
MITATINPHGVRAGAGALEVGLGAAMGVTALAGQNPASLSVDRSPLVAS